MKGRATLALGIALALVALIAQPHGAASEGEHIYSSDEIFDHLAATFKDTETLHARFEQTQQLPLLTAPVTAPGELFYRRPDRLLWRIEGDSPLVTLVQGGTLTLYYPDLGKADVIDLGPRRKHIRNLAAFVDDPRKLGEVFRVLWIKQLGDQVGLRLEPSQYKKRIDVSYIELLLRLPSWMPERISYADLDGDRRVLVFSKIERNVPLPEKIFDEAVPATVERRAIAS